MKKLMSLRRMSFAAALLAPTLAIAQAPEEQVVLATVKRLFDGMHAADSALVRSTFAPVVRFASVNARATPVTIDVETVDSWVAAIATSKGKWDEQIYDVQVRVDGNMAQVWAPYTFYLDRKLSHCGVDAFELLKDASGWKITQLSDTRRRDNCRDVLK
jgi:hypothetical protein